MAGYSGTPLLKKLGIKEGMRFTVLNAPKGYFQLLGKLPPGLQILSAPQSPMDFIHFFSLDRQEYQKRLKELKKTLSPDGTIWVSWPTQFLY